VIKPERKRSAPYLRYVASQPCLVCFRPDVQAHHLTFAQPKARGLKASDEFTVPLCVACHMSLHLHGDERKWWDRFKIDPLAVAKKLWAAWHSAGSTP
jgi:hypothetical protein